MSLITVTIGGVDRTSRINLKTIDIAATANGRDVFTCDVQASARDYVPALDDEVIVTYGATRIFGGTVRTPTLSGFGGLPLWGYTTKIQAVDYNALTDQRYAKETIPAGQNLAQVLTTLITNYLGAFGITLSGSQDTWGSLPALAYDYTQVSSVLGDLTTLTGWVWAIDYNKVLRMYAPGTIAAPFSITDATLKSTTMGDIQTVPSRTQYANRVILRFMGSGVAATATLTGTANFSNAETVSVGGKTYTFESTLTNVDGHVQLQGALTNSLDELHRAITLAGTPGVDYAAAMTANTQVSAYRVGASQLVAVALAVGAAGNSISCSDTAANAAWGDPWGTPTANLLGGSDASLSNIVIAENMTEQGLHGIWEFIASAPDVTNPTTAQSMANGVLAEKLLVPFTATYACPFDTPTNLLLPGMTQSVQCTARNIVAQSLLLMDVRTRYLAQKNGGLVLAQTVKAISGNAYKQVYQGSWRDTYQKWGGASSSSASVVSGSSSPGVSSPSYYLGGSATEIVLATGSDQVASAVRATAVLSAIVNVQSRVKVKSGTVTVTATLYDATLGAAVTGASVSANQTYQTIAFAASLVAGHEYEMHCTATAGTQVWCITRAQ